VRLRNRQVFCRSLFVILASAGCLEAQTLKQVATIDLPGPKGERFDYGAYEGDGPLPGDIIYSVNGTPVDSVDSLRSALTRIIQVFRDAKSLFVIKNCCSRSFSITREAFA